MPKAAYAVITKVGNIKENSLGKLVADSKIALSSDGKDIWVMLESPARFLFDWFRDTIDWQEWSAGRIFGSLGELRFWERVKSIHVVIVTDADSAPLTGFTSPLCLNPPDYECKFRSVHLWHGKRGLRDGAFEETRLPRGLRYPLLKATNNPGIKTKEYVCLGVPEFIRFSEVINLADQ